MDVPHRSIVAAYERTERRLDEFLAVLPLQSAHLQVWSPVLASVVLEVGSRLDSLWKLQLRAMRRMDGRAKIPDYFRAFGSVVADRWLVLWADEGQKVNPFAPWQQVSSGQKTKYAPLPWWQAYNHLKHDRWKHKEKATVRNAVLAVGGLFLAIIHCPMMGEALQESRWLHTDWNPEIVAANINDDSTFDGTQASFESSLFSYAVAHGPGPISASVYHQATPRFRNWLIANQRRPFPGI